MKNEFVSKMNGDWNVPNTHLSTNLNNNTLGLLNYFKDKIMCFPLEEGTNFNYGDIVVINEWGKAIAPEMLIDYQNAVYCMAVGSTIFTACKEDNNNTRIVLVKDIITKFNNTLNKSSRVLRKHIGKVCFIEKANTATMDKAKAMAGRIVDVVEDEVFIKVSPKWRGEI